MAERECGGYVHVGPERSPCSRYCYLVPSAERERRAAEDLRERMAAPEEKRHAVALLQAFGARPRWLPPGSREEAQHAEAIVGLARALGL